MTRTLRDYRPQHDDGCNARYCVVCEGTKQFHREILAVLDAPHLFKPKTCDCGLDALLAVPAETEVQATPQPDYPPKIGGVGLEG